MTKSLEQKMTKLAAKRDSVKRFSQEWFSIVADIEDLAAKIREAKAQENKTQIPEDLVFVDWDSYDDE